MRQERSVREYLWYGMAAEAGRMTREEWVQGLVRLARVGETEQVQLQALREIGKAFGWYGPERCEHAVFGGVIFFPPPEAMRSRP